MKSYEHYSSTGLPWCKIFPAHWDFCRAKYMYKKENRPVSEDDEVVTCFRDGMVTLRKNRRLTGFTEAVQETGYQGIRKGDLVIHVMDAFAGAIGVSDSDGKGTPVYSVCTSLGDYNNHYYAYILREMAKRGFIQSLYRGIRERSSDFRFDVFGKQYLPIPPRSEQDKIVEFLDWKVSKINKLINVKRKEIKAIDTMKRSMVSNAVTHGLNPNASMKYSGVNWLGEIPAHWETIKLRQLLHPVSVKNHPELPLLSVVREQGVIVRDVTDKEANHNYIPDDLSGYKMVKKGQFAMNKMKAWQGSYGISDYTGIVSPAYFIFDVSFDNLEYFHYAIRSKVYVNFFAQASDGIRVGQWDLQMDKMKEIPFIVPPADEQVAIVEYIKETLPRYDAAIDKLTAEVETLEEYKAKLIADVVTGKIDVRDIEIPDYEFVDEDADSGSDSEDDTDDTEEQED
jgi:type I restriction enzyme S subunit